MLDLRLIFMDETQAKTPQEPANFLESEQVVEKTSQEQESFNNSAAVGK